jgi:MFS superfamily sulfate permease-like transporter
MVAVNPAVGRLPELIGVPIETYWMIAAALAIIYLFPYVTKAVPSPLVAIIVLTVVAVWSGMDLRTVDDLANFLRHCPDRSGNQPDLRIYGPTTPISKSAREQSTFC